VSILTVLEVKPLDGFRIGRSLPDRACLGITAMALSDLEILNKNNLLNDYELLVFNGFDDGFLLCKAIREIRNSKCSIPIIVISRKYDISLLAETFRNGADEFIGSGVCDEELNARIDARMRRCSIDHSALSEQQRFNKLGNVLIDRSLRKVFLDGNDALLSPKEFDVIDFLIQKRGKVISKRDIFRAIYGVEPDARIQVICVYISNIRSKMRKVGAHSLDIQSKWGAGYVLI